MQDLTNWIKSIGFENLAILSDVDMTLIGKNANPNLVEPPAGLENNLQRLDALTDGRFFIVTGRELPYIDALFANSCFKSSCEYHNVFRLNATDGPKDMNPRPQWDLIEREIEEIVNNWPGMVLRKKPFMRTIHYSHVPALKDPATRDNVEKQLRDLLDKHDTATGHSLTIIDGGQVFDMGPGGLDKGTACASIMDYLGKKFGADKTFVPVYFGDSPGDIAAAKFVKAAGGKFVAVGDDPRITALADFRLKDPAACCAFIATLVQKPEPPRPKGPELL